MPSRLNLSAFFEGPKGNRWATKSRSTAHRHRAHARLPRVLENVNLQNQLSKLEQITALVRAANLSLDAEIDGPDVGHILDVAEAMLGDVIPALEAVAL